MTERLTMDAFEQRLAAEFDRFTAGATDPKPASEIADAAMKPRGLVARARSSRNGGRFLLLGIAAVLAASAAFVGSQRLQIRTDTPPSIAPSPVAVAVVTVAPTSAPTVPPDEWRAIVVRRIAGASPGVAISAVRPDGAERLLREVPDSVLPAGHVFQEYGTVSSTGWIALGEQQEPWNMVLVDLRDPTSEPWIVEGTSLGGIAASWGPQGLVAAHASGGIRIVNPETQKIVRTLSGGEIGGGPTIIWTEDGSGIVDRTEAGAYGVLPIEGGSFKPGFPDIFGSPGGYGDKGDTLQVCSPGNGDCAVDDGQVQLAHVDGSTTTIYEPSGPDRPSGAIFGPSPGEYFVQLDADAGRQIVVERILGATVETAFQIDRPIDWRYFGMSGTAPDESMHTMFVDLGSELFATAVVPASDGTPSLHGAQLAGYLGSAIADATGSAEYLNTGVEPLGPASDGPYPLPPIEELIAAEIALNPGHTVVGQASHNAVEDDGTVEEYTVATTAAGDLDVYIDCFGGSAITVSHGQDSVMNPCVSSGSYIGQLTGMRPGDEATVTASHDTTWRVALYTFGQNPQPGDTPPPVSEPSVP